jgi:hypothetical protein
VQHRDLLLPAYPVTFECFHLRRKRAGELVESTFCAVLLGNVLHNGEAAMFP